MQKFYLKLFLCMTLWPFVYGTTESCVEHNAQELKPIIEHAKLIAQEKKAGPPPFIAIAGCSAVGKTYFTKELAELLKQEGVNVAILKGDDFLNPDHFDPDHFHPRLEHLLMHAVIQKIKSGEISVKKPVWNQKHLRPPSKIEEIFSVVGIDIILFEGEFTLYDGKPYDFKQYSRFGIFIDADNNDILDWNWNRGREIPEKTKEEFVANNKPYLEKYRNFVKSCPTAAAYLVLKDINHRYTVHKQNAGIQSKL